MPLGFPGLEAPLLCLIASILPLLSAGPLYPALLQLQCALLFSTPSKQLPSPSSSAHAPPPPSNRPLAALSLAPYTSQPQIYNLQGQTAPLLNNEATVAAWSLVLIVSQSSPSVFEFNSRLYRNSRAVNYSAESRVEADALVLDREEPVQCLLHSSCAHRSYTVYLDVYSGGIHRLCAS